MCGIAGWFNAPPDSGRLKQMLESIQHRGPEGVGVYETDLLSFGNTRLAFVDIAAGQQPLCNENGSIWLTCNGEIFNHAELHNKLSSRHRFRTRCDVEVIIHLYEEHGTEGFRHLNGQYAFALWDATKQQFLLCRDRLGICPLYFTRAGNALYFASEIKAILSIPTIRRELDFDTLHDIWMFWNPVSGRTMFKNIHEVLPAHIMTLEPGGEITGNTRYWQLDFTQQHWTESDALETFTELFDDAVKIRLKADVPVASYLSGGLDSSMIGAFANRYGSELHTFSITFQHADYDESLEQLQVARHLGTIHHVSHCTAEDLSTVLPKMVWHTESPQLRAGPVSMIPLASSVNAFGLKGVLTGEGADEFFMGYDIFKETVVRRFMARNPDSIMRRSLVRRLYAYLPDREQYRGFELALQEGLEETDDLFFSHLFRWRNTARLQGYFQPELRETMNRRPFAERLAHLLPSGFRKWNLPSRAQALEIITFMTPYLLSSQGDRVAMASGIETRFPFLDHRIVEFANTLPQSLKLRSLRQDKYLVRKAAETHLPVTTAKRAKFPYRAPIQDMFRSKAFEQFRDILSERNIRETGIFVPRAVTKLLDKASTENMNSEMEQMALMGIVTTQLWHHLFLKGDLFPENQINT